MELHEIFSRTFSPLPDLQRAQTVSYCLSCESAGTAPRYGIRLTLGDEQGRSVEESAIAPFTPDRLEADLLLTYLYEHAVLPAQCREVVSDARLRRAQIGSEEDERFPYPPVDCGR